MRHRLKRTYMTQNRKKPRGDHAGQPTFSAYGFGCFSQYHPDFRGNVAVDLRESRDQLRGSVDECAKAFAWLFLVVRSRTRHTSVTLATG